MKLNDEWMKKALRINNARNAAAHQPDIKAIGKRLGLHGENIIELIRNECLGLLETLLGVNARILKGYSEKRNNNTPTKIE